MCYCRQGACGLKYEVWPSFHSHCYLKTVTLSLSSNITVPWGWWYPAIPLLPSHDFWPQLTTWSSLTSLKVITTDSQSFITLQLLLFVCKISLDPITKLISTEMSKPPWIKQKDKEKKGIWCRSNTGWHFWKFFHHISLLWTNFYPIIPSRNPLRRLSKISVAYSTFLREE